MEKIYKSKCGLIKDAYIYEGSSTIYCLVGEMEYAEKLPVSAIYMTFYNLIKPDNTKKPTLITRLNFGLATGHILKALFDIGF